MLPRSTAAPALQQPLHDVASARPRASGALPMFLRRLFKPNQMDFECAPPVCPARGQAVCLRYSTLPRLRQPTLDSACPFAAAARRSAIAPTSLAAGAAECPLASRAGLRCGSWRSWSSRQRRRARRHRSCLAHTARLPVCCHRWLSLPRLLVCSALSSAGRTPPAHSAGAYRAERCPPLPSRSRSAAASSGKARRGGSGSLTRPRARAAGTGTHRTTSRRRTSGRATTPLSSSSPPACWPSRRALTASRAPSRPPACDLEGVHCS